VATYSKDSKEGFPNRNAAFAAGSLPTIQFALGDASCRQRTLRQTSHRVWKDGDTGTTLYFLCDKQIRSSLVIELALILVYRILFSFFRFQQKSCAKCFCMRQGDRLMEAVHL
jgi:hypothetical protein